LHKAEQGYYANKFTQHKSDIKQTWKIIKQVINKHSVSEITTTFKINNHTTTDKAIIVKKFNEYFVNVGPVLAAKIPKSPTNYTSYFHGDYKNSFAVLPATPDEITSLIKQMTSKPSSGFDGISIDIIKLSISLIAKPLATIVNKSFSTGTFPDLLKIAKVRPVHKNGDKSEFTNYRPISVLPSFSKIFEKLMYNRLTDYLSKHCVLYKNQFGFRPNHSTSMAVIEMTNKITAALDNKQFAVGIFIDLSKAFDTLDHQILVHKLEHYGVRGTALDWFKSYLKNRCQFVEYADTKSSYLDICCGVPQGSILGPLLFLIYINDIVSASKILHLILFADDTNIFLADHNLKRLVDNLNQELTCVNNWFMANKLSLNIDKTNYILFTNRQKKIDSSELTVLLNGKSVNRVVSTKFLGVVIDEHLKWSYHISSVESKVAKNVGLLAKLKYVLPRPLLLMLYNSLILPYLSYCSIIWANENNINKLKKITILQNKSVRIICKMNYRAHAAPGFKELELLTIADISKLQLSEFMYKYSRNLLPETFRDYFTLNTEIHHYKTRQTNNYHFFSITTCIKKYSTKFSGPKLWNSLPTELKSIKSLPAFKRQLKSLLLSSYI